MMFQLMTKDATTTNTLEIYLMTAKSKIGPTRYHNYALAHSFIDTFSSDIASSPGMMKAFA